MTIVHTDTGSELSQINLNSSLSKGALAYHAQYLETLPANQVEPACLARSSEIADTQHFRISATEWQICIG